MLVSYNFWGWDLAGRSRVEEGLLWPRKLHRLTGCGPSHLEHKCLDSKAVRSKNSSFQIFARSFSDTLASIGRLGEEKNSVGTCDSPDNDDCVVLKDPSTMASAIPGVATDVPGTGTPLAGGGGVETSSTSDNALGLEVLLIGVVLVLLGGERWRVTSSATRATN